MIKPMMPMMPMMPVIPVTMPMMPMVPMTMPMMPIERPSPRVPKKTREEEGKIAVNVLHVDAYHVCTRWMDTTGTMLTMVTRVARVTMMVMIVTRVTNMLCALNSKRESVTEWYKVAIEQALRHRDPTTEHTYSSELALKMAASGANPCLLIGACRSPL